MLLDKGEDVWYNTQCSAKKETSAKHTGFYIQNEHSLEGGFRNKILDQTFGFNELPDRSRICFYIKRLCRA